MSESTSEHTRVTTTSKKPLKKMLEPNLNSDSY